MRVLAEPGRHCSWSCILASSPATTAKRMAAMLPASLMSSRSLSDGMSWFSPSTTDALLEARRSQTSDQADVDMFLFDVHVPGPNAVLEPELSSSRAEEQLGQPAVDIEDTTAAQGDSVVVQNSSVRPHLGQQLHAAEPSVARSRSGEVVGCHHLPVRGELHGQRLRRSRVCMCDVLSSRSAERLIPSQAYFSRIFSKSYLGDFLLSGGLRGFLNQQTATFSCSPPSGFSNLIRIIFLECRKISHL